MGAYLPVVWNVRQPAATLDGVADKASHNGLGFVHIHLV